MSQTGLTALHRQMSFGGVKIVHRTLYWGGIILCGTSKSVETDMTQKENGERRRRLRLGSEDVQYILLCVQNLENRERDF